MVKVTGIGESVSGILDAVRKALGEHGIDLDAVCASGAGAGGEAGESGPSAKVKVVCVSPNLSDSVAEMGGTARDQVVMVRVDEQTSRTLDQWVQTGAVHSRSEAAALFIREGLKVRASELQHLEAAMRDVEAAKARLRDRARDVLGGDA